MKVYDDINLCDFEFWGYAEHARKYLTIGDMEQIQEYLESCYPDGVSATTINDFFWHESDGIAELLGYPDFDALMKERGDDEQ